MGSNQKSSACRVLFCLKFPSIHKLLFSHTIQIKRNVQCLFLYGTTATKLPWTLLQTIEYDTSFKETFKTMF